MYVIWLVYDSFTQISVQIFTYVNDIQHIIENYIEFSLH